MAAVDQDLLSIRFGIDHFTIFNLRNGHDFELVHQDTAIFSAWASLNGAKEFSLHPRGKARLKVVSRMPALDMCSTYVMQQRLAIGLQEIVADFPILPQGLVPRWTYKERFSHGHPHLELLSYQGNLLDLGDNGEIHFERIFIVQRGKVMRHLSEMLDLPKA